MLGATASDGADGASQRVDALVDAPRRQPYRRGCTGCTTAESTWFCRPSPP